MNEKNESKKMFYVFIACMTLSIVIVGGTFAYFTARQTDNETVVGNAATVSFGLRVERVTTIDMAYGLVPMKNIESPGAAENKCKDDFGNAGCQIYRITVSTDSETRISLDGFIGTNTKEGVETRIASVYTEDEEETFKTKFTKDDFENNNELKTSYLETNTKTDKGIISGACPNIETGNYGRVEDKNCFLVEDLKLGGTDGSEKKVYVMIWVYDNGQNQDELQGMEQAYHGITTFLTTEGNKITATFD